MMQTIVNEYKPSNNEIFYHYCSANTFYKIISSKSLWLCDIRHMNDCEELLYGEKQFMNILCKSNLPKALIENILDIYKQFYNSLVLLSISFSESGEILSQWRGYADDAKGFCIGFDANSLISKLPFCPLNIIYDENEQKVLMKNIIGIIKANLNSDNLTILHLISELIEVFAQVKHPSFCEEKELRLTHALVLNEDGSLSDEVKEKCTAYNYGLHDVEFRLVDNIPTPYVSVNFPNNGDFIKEVIIGPKNHAEISDIQMFLTSNGIRTVNVKKNNFPYV